MPLSHQENPLSPTATPLLSILLHPSLHPSSPKLKLPPLKKEGEQKHNNKKYFTNKYRKNINKGKKTIEKKTQMLPNASRKRFQYRPSLCKNHQPKKRTCEIRVQKRKTFFGHSFVFFFIKQNKKQKSLSLMLLFYIFQEL